MGNKQIAFWFAGMIWAALGTINTTGPILHLLSAAITGVSAWLFMTGLLNVFRPPAQQNRNTDSR